MEHFKSIVLQYFDKVAIGLAILLFSFSAFDLYTHLKQEDSINKIEEFSPMVERNINNSNPPETPKLDYAIKIDEMFNKIPLPMDIVTRQPYKPIGNEIVYRSPEDRKPPNYPKPSQIPKKEFEPGDTEIFYKGGTSEKALIIIKKSGEQIELEQSFIVWPGGQIGESNPIDSKKQIDFMTGCRLLEIIPNAKKTINSRKTVVNLNDKGEFVDIAHKSDPYTITTMKIVYENKRLGGVTKELLVGGTANIGTVTPLLELEKEVDDKDGTGWQFSEYIQNAIKRITK